MTSNLLNSMYSCPHPTLQLPQSTSTSKVSLTHTQLSNTQGEQKKNPLWMSNDILSVCGLVEADLSVYCLIGSTEEIVGELDNPTSQQGQRDPLLLFDSEHDVEFD